MKFVNIKFDITLKIKKIIRSFYSSLP